MSTKETEEPITADLKTLDRSPFVFWVVLCLSLFLIVLIILLFATLRDPSFQHRSPHSYGKEGKEGKEEIALPLQNQQPPQLYHIEEPLSHATQQQPQTTEKPKLTKLIWNEKTKELWIHGSFTNVSSSVKYPKVIMNKKVYINIESMFLNDTDFMILRLKNAITLSNQDTMSFVYSTSKSTSYRLEANAEKPNEYILSEKEHLSFLNISSELKQTKSQSVFVVLNNSIQSKPKPVESHLSLEITQLDESFSTEVMKTKKKTVETQNFRISIPGVFEFKDCLLQPGLYELRAFFPDMEYVEPAISYNIRVFV